MSNLSIAEKERIKQVEEIIERGRLKEIFENPEIKIALKAYDQAKSGKTEIVPECDDRSYIFIPKMDAIPRATDYNKPDNQFTEAIWEKADEIGAVVGDTINYNERVGSFYFTFEKALDGDRYFNKWTKTYPNMSKGKISDVMENYQVFMSRIPSYYTDATLSEAICNATGCIPFGIKRMHEKKEALALVRTLDQLIKLTNNNRLQGTDEKRISIKGSLSAVHGPNVAKITTYGWQHETRLEIQCAILEKCGAKTLFVETDILADRTQKKPATIYAEISEAKKILGALSLTGKSQNQITISKTFTTT
jgi:hypothetical protein